MTEQEFANKIENAIREWLYGAKIVSSLTSIILALIKEAGYVKPETLADLKARARKRPDLIFTEA